MIEWLFMSTSGYFVPVNYHIWVLLYGFFGVFGTHCTLFPYLRWQENKSWQFQLKLTLAIVVCSVVGTFHLHITMLVHTLLYWDDISETVPLFLYVISLQITVVTMLLWVAIYSGWRSWHKQQNDQIRLLNLEVALRNTQLEGLRQQLNPHFIFNSLNSIRAMLIKDQNVARDMIMRISNLLHYSLIHSKQNTVRLHDEMSIVKDYLAIEQLRYGHRLRVCWDVDSVLIDLPVIPLCLQTLVENAIKHSINRYSDGIDIDIQGKQYGGQMILRVKNPGVFRSPDKPGIGINNTKRRLSIVFGERASLEVKGLSEETVLATLRIPVMTA